MEATRVETGEKVKVSNRVLTAKELYELQMVAIRQHQNTTKIANSSIPKRKQKVWEEITARSWVAATQAESKFYQMFGKLKEGDKRKLIDIQRGAIKL